MKKKKVAGYLATIASLIVLSIVTPLVINTVSDAIAGRIRGSDMQDESEALSEDTPDPDEVTRLAVETESEEKSTGKDTPKSAPEGNSRSSGSGQDKDTMIILDEPYYDEPIYQSPDEEDEINRQTYQDMTERLLTLSEASETYRKNFNPVYDELKGGLMAAFISGREQLFYDEIANFCFGHYNTSYQIRQVRFDALLEDTDEKATVILEFFTADDLKDESHVPDLKLCTYNKKTQAFVFFTGAGR